MKNLLLFYGLFFLPLLGMTQISLEPIPANGYADLENSSTEPYNVTAHASVTNNSNETKTYIWTRNIIDKPEEWGIAICDEGGCYSTELESTDFTLDANETNILDVHAYPSGSPNVLEGGVPGTAVVELVVVEMDNESNTITGEYRITIDPLVASLNNLEIDPTTLFPNPTNENFQLTNDASVDQLKIFNILGTELFAADHTQGKVYQLTDWNDGMYFVALFDKKQQLLKTLRLQKG